MLPADTPCYCYAIALLSRDVIMHAHVLLPPMTLLFAAAPFAAASAAAYARHTFQLDADSLFSCHLFDAIAADATLLSLPLDVATMLMLLAACRR